MKHTYSITGMTCNGCVNAVTEKLSKVAGVTQVEIDLDRNEGTIFMERHIPIKKFRESLPNKYSIDEKVDNKVDTKSYSESEKSKLRQLKPLLLIFLYLFSAAFLLNYKDWHMGSAMLDFMGLFYIVFSFFKFLDLKGFPESFRMYDPLAKVIPAYGWVYPFLELGLGLMFLMRFQVTVALVVTLIVLGITTLGVTRTLLDKKSIRCACLGTALKLPMTEATLIENAIMLLMAIFMMTQING